MILTAILLVGIYIGSFCVFRIRATSDECSLRWIDFPTGVLRVFYRPLISIDKLMDTSVLYEGEADELRFAQQYFCGE